jgi:2'-5' RNA ligase
MPRLFTGLEIPRDIADRLMLLRGDVPTARWIDPANYHITLRFLGDVSNAVADEFAARLELLTSTPFDVELQGIGYFGSRFPHTLWVGVRTEPALAELVRAHERAAVAVGLPPETRAFAPHVTLARLGRCRAGDLAPFLESFAAFRAGPFRVARVILYSSRPSQGGGPYAIEAEYPLVTEA